MGKGQKYGVSRIKIVFAVLLPVLIIVAGAAFYAWSRFEVKTVSVTGNRHYTQEQICDIVMEGKYGHNSLYLYYRYRNKNVTGIPFVETMDVDIVSPTEISITVYEKAIAGYVEYLGRYMYFDKDGIVVESSTTQARDLPYVTGLKFSHVVMYEKLPVEDDQIFKEILSVTQLLAKYEIATDKIYFDHDRSITLYFDNAKVKLGSMESIDEKMAGLRNIIPKLEGLSGTLDMSDYSDERGGTKSVFQRDDVETHIAASEMDKAAQDGESVSADGISENKISGNSLPKEKENNEN